MNKYREKAMALFKEGFNCSQSVLIAFEDRTGLDRNTAAKIASSFGGGMGRLREVCGAVSGMFMVVGFLYGYSSPKDKEGKAEHYKLIQELAQKFRERNRYIVCRELLGLNTEKDNYIPSERTAEYYKKRPCAELIGDAAEILSEFIEEKESLKSKNLAL